MAGSTILMIRPVAFSFNAETAASNAFQDSNSTITAAEAQKKTLQEFNDFVATLEQFGVKVLMIDDTPAPHTPDSIFPNNWISFHDDGTLVLYPMLAKNRRQERRADIIESIKEQFEVKKVIDLSHYEKENKFLEGTGSIVFDYKNKIAYACRSPRTEESILKEVCEQLNYEYFLFDAVDEQGQAIYHTNVLMCVDDPLVVLCEEAVGKEKEELVKKLRDAGHQILNISFDQLNHFAGNMYALSNAAGEKLLVMSAQALESLEARQIKKIEENYRIVSAPINTIEQLGGGSARCMMADIRLVPALN